MLSSTGARGARLRSMGYSRAGLELGLDRGICNPSRWIVRSRPACRRLPQAAYEALQAAPTSEQHDLFAHRAERLPGAER